MSQSLGAEALIAFEADIATCFNAGLIRAPVHLAGGNEEILVELFREVQPNDWVLCQWRSHLHCLLKGVPASEVNAAILAGRSIALCFPQFRVLCSAIAGGIAPIAVGLAWEEKRRNSGARVHCFVGDMTSCMGIVEESRRYALNFRLPIRWIVENNGKSVMTDTEDAWGEDLGHPKALSEDRWYSYTLPWPHAGAGKRVEF